MTQEEIKKMKEAFLAKGGKVTVCPPNSFTKLGKIALSKLQEEAEQALTEEFALAGI